MHCALLFAVALAQGQPPLQAPSQDQSWGGFYTKMLTLDGMPILASSKVSDRALYVVRDTFRKMLAKAPKKTMKALVQARCTFSIIGATEGQTDLPEYADLKNDPNMDWNKRARGLGGQRCSGAEENILELPGDRYHGESIFIHEFAHTLDEFGFSKVVKGFSKERDAAFEAARKAGLWDNTYANSNPAEYFAEGVQDYFDCNRSAVPSNGIHNEICTREGLARRDPRLFALIDRCFGKVAWRYQGAYSSTPKRSG